MAEYVDPTEAKVGDTGVCPRHGDRLVVVVERLNAATRLTLACCPNYLTFPDRRVRA